MKVVFKKDWIRPKSPHKPPVKAGKITNLDGETLHKLLKDKVVEEYTGSVPAGENLYIYAEELEAQEKETARKLKEIKNEENRKQKEEIKKKSTGEKLITD